MFFSLKYWQESVFLPFHLRWLKNKTVLESSLDAEQPRSTWHLRKVGYLLIKHSQLPLRQTPSRLPPKKSKFNDVCVLFEHSIIFTPECWKCTLRCLHFKVFSGGLSLNPPSNSCFCCWQVAPVPWVFSFSIYCKAFVTLKPYWKPCTTGT